VLFVFVIMLLGAEQIGSDHPQRWFQPLAILLGAILLAETVYIMFSQHNGRGALFATFPGSATIINEFGSPKSIGTLLFNQYLLPFEATSILLLVALVGAIILTKRVDAGTGMRHSPEGTNTQTEKK
jgi:NADH-quinone oxidoreductase subunit J